MARGAGREGKTGRRGRRTPPKEARAREVRAMVEARMAEEVDEVQRHLDRYIGRRYFGGLYVLFRALVTTVSKHMRNVLLRQLGDILDTLEEPMTPELLRHIMRSDVVTLYLRKDHPHYERAARMGEELALANREFLAALVRAGERLGAKRWPLAYEEIQRAAYPLRSEAKAVLMERFRKASRIIDLIRKDPQIVNLPLGRKMLLDVLEEGVRYSREIIDRRLDETYSRPREPA